MGSSENTRTRTAPFIVAIFSGSFLLFLVQPTLGQYILPWFGGSPATWTACLLFFQTGLLLGYLYAHYLTVRLGLHRALLVHAVVLILSILQLPLQPDPAWKLSGDTEPTFRVLGALISCVGLPYVLLSSTSPLIQAWFARCSEKNKPYRFYAWSNAGSFLALALFPLVLAPNLGRVAQTRLWSLLYVLCICLVLWCAYCTYRSGSTVSASGAVSDTSPWRQKVFWFVLPMVSSLLLMAVTHGLSQDISVTPVLWIVPLGLYLLTFTLVFAWPGLYRRWRLVGAYVVAVAVAIWMMEDELRLSMTNQFLAYNGILFVCCMLLHGELERIKPDPSALTRYYLYIAIGSVLGSVIGAIILPGLFDVFIEFPVGLVATGLVFLLLIGTLKSIHAIDNMRRTQKLLMGLVVVTVLLSSFRFGQHFMGIYDRSLVVSRSFYGFLRVSLHPQESRKPWVKNFLSGRISHGFQHLRSECSREPTAYFVRGTGVGLAMDWRPDEKGRRFGVVGLGIGTLAAYGKPGDEFRFYEINPDVIDMASTHFSFLADTPATWSIVTGDGRQSLELEARALEERKREARTPDELQRTEESAMFDVLVLDAFSGDSVPAHLLTREAMDTYLALLKPDGILAINVTNAHINLLPVIQAHVGERKMEGRWVQYPRDENQYCDMLGWKGRRCAGKWLDDPSLPRDELNKRKKAAWYDCKVTWLGAYFSYWVLMSHNQHFLGSDAVEQAITERPPAGTPLVWTDDHAPIWPLLK